MFLKSVSSKCYCIISLFLLFIIYNQTISPAIYWRDGPEFVNTSYTFGIAHPAGFPAYSIISKLFTFLPFSNIAMRVNYVSLFFAVLTCWTAFYIIIQLINLCYEKAVCYHTSLAAMLSILLLGFAFSYWWQATVAEIYTMNTFFLSLFFLIALKWYQSRDPRHIMLGSLVFGIASAVYGANLLFLPVLIIFYLLVEVHQKPRYLIFASMFFILGYSIYLYLPIRSILNPPFDWGNPETLNNFISHITDKKDELAHFKRAKSLSILLKSFAIFGQVIVDEVTLIGIALGSFGLIVHFKKEKISFFLFALVGLIHAIFFLTSFGEIQSGSVFLLFFLIYSFWIGLGIYVLLESNGGNTSNIKYGNIVVPLIVAFIIFSLVKDYSKNNKSSYYLPKSHAENMYKNVGQDSIIFSYLYYFPFRYLKDVAHLRPDITIISIPDTERPDLYNQVNSERFPLINFPHVVHERRKWDKFLQALISVNIKNRPIYWDLKEDLTQYNYEYLIPDNKFLMRFSEEKVEKIPEDLLKKYIMKLKQSMDLEMEDEQFFLDHETGARGYYYTFLTSFADYLMRREMFQKAIPFLDLALTITDSGDIHALSLKGVCLMNTENIKQAEELFLKLYTQDKGNYANIFNLAALYFGIGELEKSKKYIRETLALKNNFAKSYFLLGKIHSEEGNYDQAIKEITYAIEKTNFISEKKKMEAVLEKVKRSTVESNADTESVQPSAISIQ